VVIAALGFLAVLGPGRTPSAQALRWFPLVGALLGAVVGGVWWLAAQVWPPAVAAAVALTADLVLTGMLHLDGLADSGDGLLPPLDRARRLEVMADPATGAFGVGTVVATLLLRWAAFAALVPDVALVAGVWAASRTLMAVVVSVVPYARGDGLAAAFTGGASGWPPAVVGVGGVVLAALLEGASAGGSGVAAVLATVLVGGAVVALAGRRLGGYTGDVLGAAGVVGETAGLLVAAARW
jgi:adenosylcobinamide-GDP ribazoletransferase